VDRWWTISLTRFHGPDSLSGQPDYQSIACRQVGPKMLSAETCFAVIDWVWRDMSSDHQGHSKIEVGSTRSFGIVFCVVFALIGLYPLLGGSPVRIWSLIISGVFLFFAFFFSSVLQPLNVLWFRFGMLLARIVNPIVMFIIYIVTIVPFGLGARLFGKDLLRLKLERDQASYWVEREPPGPKPKSLENQF
jgi:hypothetical protein